MDNPIKILIAEHDPADLELIQHELQKGHINYVAEIIQNEESYITALKNFSHDIILCDYSFPAFNGAAAFEIKEQIAPATPFIIVSGAIGEEKAVELIKTGVTDYVLKDRLLSLPTKIKRALEEAKEKVEKDTTAIALQVALNDIKKTAQEIRWLIDNTEEAFILLDRKLDITSFNNQAQLLYSKYFGKELVKGHCILDYAPAERLEGVKKIYKKVLNGSEEVAEIIIPQNGSATKNFSIKYKPAKNDEGQIIGVFVSAIDVTESRKAEDQKKFEQRDKEALINSTNDLIWSVSNDLKLIAANHAFFSSLKVFTSETVEPGNQLLMKGKFPAGYLDFWEGLYKKALQGKAFMNEVFTPAGENYPEKWSETSFNPIYDGDTISGIACYSRDTTVSKNFQNKLVHLNKKLETAQQIASLGYWELSQDYETLYWSNEVYNIWGVSPDVFNVSYKKFYDSIHPDDRADFDRSQNNALSGKGKLDVEHRIILPNGEIKCVHEKGELVYNDRREIIRFEGTVQDITNRKEAEVKMKELANRLLLATNSASLGIWDWDIKSNHLVWDEGMHKLYEISSQELGSSYEGWLSRLHPEDKDKVNEDMQMAIAGTKPFKTKFRILRKDLSVRYIKATGMVEKDNAGNVVRMIGTSADITKQKEREEQLKLLESVITNTTDSVLITEAEPFDEPGPKIIYVNEAFTAMTGYTAAEVMGKTPRLLQGPKTDKNELKRLSEALRKWEPCEITTINYKKNGDEFWINFSINPVANAEGWFTHWIAIERDITERKLSEIRLNDLNEHLQLQAKELALSNAELEQFAYIASHDLQEPLRMVTSFLTLLEKKYENNIDEKGKKYIAFAVDGAKRMRQIILDLLEFSRVGRTEENLEDINLNELVKEIRILFRKKIEEEKAVISSDELPVIKSYKAPIRQVFHNLVSNALKYASEDITCQVHITVREFETYWQFAITDNGIGIGKEYFDKVFIIFQRLHNKDEYSGTGMGLTITKKIIENLGGTIWIESEVGKGSTFYFTIKK